MHIDTDAMNNRRAKTSLEKYVPLTLLLGFEKGYSGFYCERELETEQRLLYIDPTLMAINVVSFLFSRAAQPEAQRPTLLAFSTASYHQLVSKTPSGVPRAPFGWVWLSLPHLVSIFSGPQLIRAPRAPSAGLSLPQQHFYTTKTKIKYWQKLFFYIFWFFVLFF